MPSTSDQLDSHIRVVTPENIAFEYRVASPFERAVAYLIDGIIMTLAIAAIGLVLMLLFGLLGGFEFGFGMLLVAWFVISWFYGGVFETFWNGQTPGKKSMGLRVVRTDGSPINAGQAVLRNFLRVVDSQPANTHLAGLVATAMNRRYQRLGDLACATMVIAEDRSRATRFNEIADVMVAPIENMLPPGALPSRTLAKAISQYVDRRRYFGPARRAEIARHVGEAFVEKYNLPPGIDHDALLCVLYRRAFLTARAEEQQELERQVNPYLLPEGQREFELPAMK
ncbi:RDD family protein [Aeoliella sp. SH292]|uniref:RDD family protein n=1 Tax=Aeoliella sp. SH292 TaxID=3454464 RepID=UPI003F96CAD8